MNKSHQEPVHRTIVLADVAGFCFGVRRAVDLTLNARNKLTGELTTLGPLIHNSQVIDQLAQEGVGYSATLDQIQMGTVIMSAHGVAPSVLQEAKARGLGVVDVTCPFVTRVHRCALELLRHGYQVVMVGDAGHSEVRGVAGAVHSAGGELLIISTVEAAEHRNYEKRVGIVSQTTMLAKIFGQIVGTISSRTSEVKAVNTICGATDELQAAAVRMARRVELALVIGGRNSANTRRLCQLCAEHGVPAYQIETADELNPAWLEDIRVVGITAGASTPDCLIESVARAVNGGELPAGWRLQHPDAELTARLSTNRSVSAV